ncbi:MAG: helix-turn-helix transcriptional regulator [Saprospiraceae bacterium]
MADIFKTFKPKEPTVAKYVDYYYLDIKPENEFSGFRCFPHYNSTISLYRSHKREKDNVQFYDKNAGPLQIFTPVREKMLEVKQVGRVHRIVIVFHLLGIQQFYRDLNFSAYILGFDFFNKAQLSCLFQTADPAMLTDLLDQYLLERYIEWEHPLLNEAVQSVFDQYGAFSVEQLAREYGISRRHLNRIFKDHIGVSVKKLQTIVRFRKALERKLFFYPEENFTQLAYALDFSDQAHLNKTFEKLTQYAPRQFFQKGTRLGREDTFWHLDQI